MKGKNDLIYVRMPRCGSTSISNKMDQLGFRCFGGGHMGFNTHSKLGIKKPSNPKLALCIKNYLGEKKFNNGFKFSFVRNPWDRAVSMWHNVHFKHIKSFKKFCDIIYKNKDLTPEQRWHSQECYFHLYDENDNCLLDFIGYFENLENELNKVLTKNGFNETNLPKLWASKNRNSKNYRDYYDEETKEIINEIYNNDIVKFNYDFT